MMGELLTLALIVSYSFLFLLLCSVLVSVYFLSVNIGVLVRWLRLMSLLLRLWLLLRVSLLVHYLYSSLLPLLRPHLLNRLQSFGKRLKLKLLESSRSKFLLKLLESWKLYLLLLSLLLLGYPLGLFAFASMPVLLKSYILMALGRLVVDVMIMSSVREVLTLLSR